jgi:predicted nucleic acid-binding protein
VILFDTNVLVYALNADSPHHSESRTVVEAALTGRLPGVLVPQVLLEAYAVLTDRRRVERPLAPEEAQDALEPLRVGLRVLPAEAHALEALRELIALRRPVAQEVFDVFLAAQMRAHGIPRLCTYDVDGFRGYPGVAAATPAQILQHFP